MYSICKQTVIHKPCSVRVKFTLIYDYLDKKNTCRVDTNGHYLHGVYARKHISDDSKQKFTERVKEDPYITPNKMTTGISSSAGRITEAARKIDPILSNQDRVKYELNVARSALGIHKSSDFLGEFQNIQREYEGYITYAEVASKESFIIVFTPPGIGFHHLPFSTQPIITAVT
ncbi:hypothetical protein [Parasitella parasitica]|uniref:Uncharacterized protein n=1 Tax=Parasitella parasitica TaxID=35722 RepID=A0A0B7MZJ2_9FUNG|nr:hypothetical protein [Parasitella parasitica]